MTTALQSITDKAQTHPKHVFQNLSALLDEGLMFESWGQLKKNVAPGIDNIDAQAYSQELSAHITALVDKLKRGAYRANRIKRVYIDKANGGQRPLGLPTLEDKLVQQSAAQILSSIYEADFLPNSYGYRPNRSAHGAIHSLRLNLQYKGYGYIVEADIKGYLR
jgi:RNA-directed DNA polymerase